MAFGGFPVYAYLQHHDKRSCAMIGNCTCYLNESGYGIFFFFFLWEIDGRFKKLLSMIEHVGNVNYMGFLDLTFNKGYNSIFTYDMMLFPTLLG